MQFAPGLTTGLGLPDPSVMRGVSCSTLYIGPWS